MINRLERLQQLLKKEISMILQEDVDNPEIERVTITKVELTRDLGLVKVYCSISGEGPKRKEEIIKALKKAGRFVRGEIAKRVSMKYIPRVSFREDTSAEKMQKIDAIFKKIANERGGS